MVKVIHLKVGKQPVEKEIEGDDLPTLQSLVGGSLEAIFPTANIAMYLNEEGKLMNLAPNFNIIKKIDGKLKAVDVIVGDVFFATHNNEGEMESLTNEMIDEIMTRFIDRVNFLYR